MDAADEANIDAYWEGPSGGVLETLPHGLSVERALEWAQARALAVYVQGGGWTGYRSVGSENEFDFPTT